MQPTSSHRLQPKTPWYVLLMGVSWLTLLSCPACAQEGEAPHPPLPSKEEIRQLPPDGGPQFNRLIFESSPYLRQHARNPVDWYPWCAEAFERAQREDKLIFLSVGYSTCHWCHVMERESFENAAIARVLNEHFIAIKVDREERPDIDAIYMAAVQAMTGRGGWPMSMFLTHDQKPIWGGTYFPPDDRMGRPGFQSILKQLADLWKTRREELLQGSMRLMQHLREQSSIHLGATLGADTLKGAYDYFARQYDAAHGGFGSAPKFPRSHSLSFLLRYHQRSGEPRALAMVEATLAKMAQGGLRDHLGGGFHRYSTDEQWLVPHFEKMLYDQALLARTYLETYQVTHKPIYVFVARDIFEYVLREMSAPSGAFYSAEDADSEGVEGKFYVWTKQQLRKILGDNDLELFCRVYGISDDGNYHDESTEENTGANILYLPNSLADVAQELGLQSHELEARLAPLRAALFAARRQRVYPYKDDKILSDWNGLMIAALAYGGRALQEPRYIHAAQRAAIFVTETMVQDGRLLHRHRDGHTSIKAFLEDYAFLSLGLLELYEATLEIRWLSESKRLAEQMIQLFWDERNQGFQLSGSDAERLILETQELYDGAIPSGNSAATLVLARLGRLLMDQQMIQHAEHNLRRFSGLVDQFPAGYPVMLMALDFTLGPVREVVIAGSSADPAVRAMWQEIQRRFLPNLVLVFRPTEEQQEREVVKLIPFLAELKPVDGKATAYVCRDYACDLPTTDLAQLTAAIDGRSR